VHFGLDHHDLLIATLNGLNQTSDIILRGILVHALIRRC
jgi:hypothetical protein